MARAKKRIVAVEIPDETSDEDQEKTSATQAAEEDIRRAAAESPKAAETRVVRLDPERGTEMYIGKFATALVSEEFLAKRFGGGKFKLTHKKPDARGVMVYAGMETITIDASIQPERNPAPATNVPVSGAPSLSETLLITMMKQQSDAAQQNITMMQGFMTALTTAFSALKPSGPDPVMIAVLNSALTRKDPTEIATALLTVMKGEKSEKSSIAELKEMLELMEMLPGKDGKGETNEMDLIGKGLDVVATALASGGKKAESLPSNPATDTVHEDTSTHQEETTTVATKIDPNSLRPWQRSVAPLLPRLSMAMTFMSPLGAADTMWNNSTDGALADLRADINAGDDASIAAFVERAFTQLKLDEITKGSAEAAEWAKDTLRELAAIVMAEEEEETPKGRKK